MSQAICVFATKRALLKTDLLKLRFVITLVSLALLTISAVAQEGKKLYQSNCASCHGDKLQGSGLGPPLSETNYIYGGLHHDIIRVIENGIKSRGMPSFINTLSKAQITEIADFLPSRTVEKNAQKNKETKSAAAKELDFDNAIGSISTLDYSIKMQIIANGLETPWAAVVPDADTILLTERIGRLRLIKNGKLLEKAIEGTPEVLVSSHKWNQGGLLDIALHPDYKKNGWIYLSYSHSIATPNIKSHSNSNIAHEQIGMLRIVRGKIKKHAWTNQELVYEASHDDYHQNHHHYGGRMVFNRQGYLYFSVGDRGAREQAREPHKPWGKIHRLHADGRIPDNNPFHGVKGALPSIFSVGHRNPQGLALDPKTGTIWSSEHGPRGGDELNILKPTGDYGWPAASYGINYNGTLLTPNVQTTGTEQPIIYWRPSIGVSGISIYQGGEFPLWNNKILVTSLATRELRLLTVDNERVQHQETLVTFEGRPYSPIVGPDGAIYITLDSPGQLIRLSAIDERKL